MNNILKRGILRIRTNRNLKQRLARENEDFKESRRIGILYSDLFENEDNLRIIANDLRETHKEVSILVFCHNPKKAETTFPYFTIKDISTSGEFKNDALDFFTKQTYDFALCFDQSNHYAVNYVFSTLIAKCRVGIHQSARSHFFDLMVQNSQENGSTVSNEVLKYLKMIHT